jgi:hypothetical protein
VLPAAPAPPPIAPQVAWRPAEPVPPAAPEPLAIEEALSRLKTAALATRGAHLTYLRFSERELAAGGGERTGGYSDGYVSAWFTLTDAVAALQQARADLDAARVAAGQAAEVASQPDLAHLLAELEPYFNATGDDAVHAAFLTVARAEAAGS